MIINKIKNKIWRKRGKWHPSITFSEIFGEGEFTSSSVKLGYPFKRTRGIWLENGDYFDLEEEWTAIRKIVDEQYAKDPNYLKNYAEKCLKLGEELIIYSNVIQLEDLSNWTDKQLANIYTGLITKCKDFMPFMFSLHLFDEFLTEKFEDLLNEFVRENGLSNNDYFEYQTALITPFRKIFVLQEKYDLISLAHELKKSKLDIDSEAAKKMLTIHTYNYAWINSVLLEKEPYKLDYFKNALSELLNSDIEKEHELMMKNESESKQRQIEYMDKIKSSKELLHISKTVQKFGFLRSFRCDAPYSAIGNCWNLISEIAERMGINALDIKYLDSKEVGESLLGQRKNFRELIAERKMGFLSVMVDDERHSITSKGNIKHVLQYITLPEHKQTSVVKGSVAYAGKVTGVCKVLHSLDDMEKVNPGDVLVISMTDPNYIPAMEKAAAFVTDFGGILCHAAIISREMKKPCIIGTKNATKVLKDGDLVEVDAKRGIVKKVIGGLK